MFRLYCWICVTWQTYRSTAVVFTLRFLSFLLNKFTWRNSAPTYWHAAVDMYTSMFVPPSPPQTDKTVVYSGGSEPRSNTEKFCLNVHKLPLRLSCCLRTFTRSDTWQPETGKGLCVTAVKGTDQISHSTLNCHRSAKIKGEKITGVVP